MAWWRELWNWLRPGKSEVETEAVEQPSLSVRPANWNDVFFLLRLLEKHGVDYTLVGGYALNFNGLVRQTGDVDILVANSPDNNRRWIAALSELPDGAAAVLAGDGDDPFAKPGAEAYDDEPGVIRVADEFIVDVMPSACGLTLDDLRPYVRRVHVAGGEVSILDLAGLRLTKQGMRHKDRLDLEHIEAALAALRGQLTEHVDAMSRRPLAAIVPPPDGSYAFHPGTPVDRRRRELAEAVLARAAEVDGTSGLEVETLEIYCDTEMLEALLRREEPITDLSAELSAMGVTLPRMAP